MQKLLINLEKSGITLMLLDLEKPGYYHHATKTIFVSSNQSDEDIIRVIYHELKHALDHSDYAIIYRKPIPHIKMESEANEYMIKQIINENGGIYNYTLLVEAFKIGMGNDVKYGNS